MRRCLPVLALVLAGWACFVVGRQSDRIPSPDPVDAPAARATAGARLTTAARTPVRRADDTSTCAWLSELETMRELAASNPRAALAAVAQMRDKHERKSAAQEVCLVVAASDPARAMIAAWELGLGRFADELNENAALERLARRWAESDPAGVLAWAATLPGDDESRRDRVVRGIAAAIASNHPDIAAQLVAEGISPGSLVQLEAALEVLRQWAAHDYAGALRWTALFPDGALRERGVEALVSSIRHE